MVTQAENERLTRVGAGTSMGELLRRYWQPAALSEELPTGGAPLPITLMGEELVLFRSSVPSPSGGRGEGEGANIGLLNLHCSHRGADLSYGRLEDGGLRCIYHGWLYDRNGRCLEQPGEPAFRWTDSGGRDSVRTSDPEAQPQGGSFRDKIRHKAYPCQEVGGLILAYLGPGRPPLVPTYEFLTAPETHRFATKAFHDCNFL
ncbi:MAG TPA: Rieske 2Fe-2S domain-containing protein, partial [Chloroflexota bacterium]